MSDQTSEPDGWRFLVPTICDFLPDASKRESVGEQVLRLYEDDWRQIELVAQTRRPEVMRALTEIATIRIASEGAPGFARVCVRSGLEDLLDDAAVTVSEIESWLGGIEQHFDGVGFVERPGVIPGSFAFLASDGTSVYGVQQNGLVQIAGFRSSIPESFMSLANDSSLLIVDWIHASIVGA